jgi:hypothetical protein
MKILARRRLLEVRYDTVPARTEFMNQRREMNANFRDHLKSRGLNVGILWAVEH